MKTKIILLLMSCAGFAQNLSLTGNINLGQNCGNGQHQTFTYQDVNLNGYNIDLRNATLNVLHNLNGNGSITKCGNQNNSFVCVNGAIQNNPNLNGLTCQNLNTENFVLSNESLDLNYKVFDILGKVVKTGKTSIDMYEDLSEKSLYIVKVEGYKPFKIIK